MSHHPLIPAKPTRITLDTLPDLFAHHRARFGGLTMTQGTPEPNGQQGGSGDGGQQQGNDDGNQAPERPEDIPEDTWATLGDPGKQAIVRERERANAAERALAASRQRPTPPRNPGAGSGASNSGGQGSGSQSGQGQQSGGQQGQGQQGDQPDFAALIQQAVSEAVKPFAEAEERRQTETAAERVRSSVLEAAKTRLHDATDALVSIDLAAVVNEQGAADPDKVKTALDDLVTRKPHLAKSTTRTAPPGIGGGAPAAATEGEKVKAALAEMQKATGVRPPASSNT